jgi:hypothetical protein
MAQSIGSLRHLNPPASEDLPSAPGARRTSGYSAVPQISTPPASPVGLFSAVAVAARPERPRCGSAVSRDAAREGEAASAGPGEPCGAVLSTRRGTSCPYSPSPLTHANPSASAATSLGYDSRRAPKPERLGRAWSCRFGYAPGLSSGLAEQSHHAPLVGADGHSGAGTVRLGWLAAI